MSEFYPKKKYGQNFLVSKAYIEKIVQTIVNEKPEHVIEIGPGRGEITIPLAKKVPKLTAIEIDTDLVKLIDKKIKAYDISNVKLVHADILELPLEDILEDNTIVVGNLPYNISSVILSKLEIFRHRIRKAIVMLQKEVAERLCAVPGRKAYGSLSIFTQYNSSPRLLFVIKRTCFWPRPEVDSALVSLDYLSPYPRRALDEEVFKNITGIIFRHRRKTILNALSYVGLDVSRVILEEMLLKCGIDPKIRPEELGIQQLLDLSDLMVSSGIILRSSA